MKIYCLLVALLSFNIHSAEHCEEYVSAYKSDKISNVFDSFMNGLNEIPSPVGDEFRSQFLILDVGSKIIILENVLKECFASRLDEDLGTVIKKVMDQPT